jgi:GTP-binding protein
MKPRAEFLTSAAEVAGFPADSGKEVAVVGRSNSGKSSAINAMLGSTRLARVSKAPGRTQLINFFAIAQDRRVVDLPGYGYARVPRCVRERWNTLVTGYFESRRCLVGLIVTIDIRRGVQSLDRRMIEWAQALQLPLMLLATKADKLSRGAGASAVLAMRADLPRTTVVVPFSAPKDCGVVAANRQLSAWLEVSAADWPGRL